jgi:GxxExxY protein
LIHEALCNDIIGAAIEVHRALGPGLLESAYEVCMAYELERRGVPFLRELRDSVVITGSNA